MTLAEFKAWRLKLIAWLDRERGLPPVVVLRETLHELILRDSVPATFGDCPSGPCPHVRCRYNLWRDDTPSGRPGLGSVPRGERGRTLPVLGQFATASPPTLSPRWLESPTPESCALRVAGRGPQTNTQTGGVTSRHRTLVARDVKRALSKAKRVAAGMGMSEEELLRGLRELGAGV